MQHSAFFTLSSIALGISFAMALGVYLALGSMLFAGYLLGINLVIIVFYSYDKKAAIHNKVRIPESVLLLLALLGASLGAYYAARRFRHKTIKRDYNLKIGLIIMFQMLLIVGYIELRTRGYF